MIAIGKKKKPCPTKYPHLMDGVILYPDGREVCESTPQGTAEYSSRRLLMADRQRWACALCGKLMNHATVSFDHQNGRSTGKRDDRTEVEGVWLNAAVHIVCNVEKGSKRTSYQITQETSR